LLTPEEQTYVVERIATIVLAFESVFRPRLVAPLDPLFARTIPEVPVVATLAAARVLQLCIEDGWNRQPPSVVRFLSLLPLDSTAEKIIQRLQKPPDPGDDLDLASLLSTDEPFLNRAKLRAKLKILERQDAPKPILIVTGDSLSGKSYSAGYVEDFCLRRPHISVSRQRLFLGTAWPTCSDLACDIVSSMGRPRTNVPPQNTNADRWPRDLANWVLFEANQTPYNWWFLFDGFDSPNVTKDCRAFINFLADSVTSGIYVKKYRVILLGYERGSLTVRPGQVDIEKIESIEDDEIKSCIHAILKRAGVTASPEKFLQPILDGLPTDGRRHSEINRRLRELIETVQV
jgi:hypothetical protein